MTAPLEFHRLNVGSVDPLTDDAVAITLDVPGDLRDVFRYLPGQHITLRADIDGEDVRRTYSICSNANSSTLRIGVKRLNGGVFSTYATSRLRRGDRLDVMTPIGDFTITPNGRSPRSYVAIVAGSGITPVLSMVATTLESEPKSWWSVVYGNRDSRSVMFLEELEALKDRYPTRLQLFHVLSREDTGLDLTSGRIDAKRLRRFFATLIPPRSVDHFLLCGPYEMVRTARRELTAAGVPEAAIADELFFTGPPDPNLAPPPPPDQEGVVELAFTLQGRLTRTTMVPGTTVLDAALAVRSELPFSCKGGMCATCKAHVVEGKVRMDKNYALVEADLEAGYVLTCQSHPLSDRVVIDFDRR